ncbi:uncharacterized protein LOC129708946 [Leucoraja erinacea]|uniref:uncharacterized protein LOC129708946 n=1 Tax=Leucoraja erinaceus TaxID=7782 RepID=UPI002453F5FF|nr:uncharacterized protein LOC129708946 [Leucoraja erinacea]
MAGDENKTDPVTLCGDSGAGNQPCGSFKCLNMGLQRWIGFMVLVEMVWQVSATGTGPISREWGEEANLPGWNAREPRQVNEDRFPDCQGRLGQPLLTRHSVIIASPGNSVTLYCKISKDYGALGSVSWSKDGVSIATFRTFAKYQRSDVHRWFVYQNVIMHRDASLVLTQAQEDDEAIYSCRWTTYNYGKCEEETWLLMD